MTRTSLLCAIKPLSLALAFVPGLLAAASQPDLIPVQPRVLQASAAPGATVSISWTIRNQGSGAAGASVTGLRWTTASGSWTAVVRLANQAQAAIPALSLGTQQTLQVAAPSTPGTYYLQVICDNVDISTLNQVTQANDAAWSPAFTVAAPAAPKPPTPSISSVLPVTLGASYSNQNLTISGGPFQVGALPRFTSPSGRFYYGDPAKTAVISQTGMIYGFNSGGEAGGWWVAVANPGGDYSLPYPFDVIAPASPPTTITVTSDRFSAKPGETITFRGRVLNASGSGVANVQVGVSDPFKRMSLPGPTTDSYGYWVYSSSASSWSPGVNAFYFASGAANTFYHVYVDETVVLNPAMRLDLQGVSYQLGQPVTGGSLIPFAMGSTGGYANSTPAMVEAAGVSEMNRAIDAAWKAGYQGLETVMEHSTEIVFTISLGMCLFVDHFFSCAAYAVVKSFSPVLIKSFIEEVLAQGSPEIRATIKPLQDANKCFFAISELVPGKPLKAVQALSAGWKCASMVVSATDFGYTIVARPAASSSSQETYVISIIKIPGRPSVSQISPAKVPVSSSNVTINVLGDEFDRSCYLLIKSPSVAEPFRSKVDKLTYIDGQHLSYAFNSGSEAGIWALQVVHPTGGSSTSFPFEVVPVVVSPSPTPSASRTMTPGTQATRTSTPSPAQSLTRSATSTPGTLASPVLTATRTFTPSPAQSLTRSVTSTPGTLASPVFTATRSATQTSTRSPTPGVTGTRTSTGTAAAATRTPTATATVTSTAGPGAGEVLLLGPGGLVAPGPTVTAQGSLLSVEFRFQAPSTTNSYILVMRDQLTGALVTTFSYPKAQPGINVFTTHFAPKWIGSGISWQITAATPLGSVTSEAYYLVLASELPTMTRTPTLAPAGGTSQSQTRSATRTPGSLASPVVTATRSASPTGTPSPTPSVTIIRTPTGLATGSTRTPTVTPTETASQTLSRTSTPVAAVGTPQAHGNGSAKDLVIVPNPFRGEGPLVLELPLFEGSRWVDFRTLLGETVVRGSVEGGQRQLRFRLPYRPAPGVYFLCVERVGCKKVAVIP